jgi:hypothetical protein
VAADDRLTRLRALIAKLERLPASPKAEWMLAEARARMVDVETGERPRALRPLAEEPPPSAAGPPARTAAGARAKKPAGNRPPKAVERSAEAPEGPGAVAPSPRPSDDEAAFGAGGLLSLQDSPT